MKDEKESQWIWGEKEKKKSNPPGWLPARLEKWNQLEALQKIKPILKLWYFISLSSKQKPTVLKPWCHVPEVYRPVVCTAVVVTHLDQTPQSLCILVRFLCSFTEHSSARPVTGTVCALMNWWPEKRQILISTILNSSGERLLIQTVSNTWGIS